MVTTSGKATHDKREGLRFIFDQDGALRCYEVCPTPPNLDIFAERFDLGLQMDADGLSLSEITERLRRCAESYNDVEKVSLYYNGCRYSVVVVLRELCDETLSDIYSSFEEACRTCGAHRPTVTVLGPQQGDCFVLSAVDAYVVYSNAGTLKVPAIPPLG